MSLVVGVNPPVSFTGLGVFAGRDLLAAMPLRINSAIASLSFFRSCTARILTARIRSSGRSRVVFIETQIPRKLVFCQFTYRSSLRRNDFPHEGFEPRITVQGIEQGIDFDPADI